MISNAFYALFFLFHIYCFWFSHWKFKKRNEKNLRQNSETADWHTRKHTYDGSVYQNCPELETKIEIEIITKLLEQNRNYKKCCKRKIEPLKGVGRGRSIMVGGPAAGLRGNSHKVDPRQRGGAQVATTGGQVHRGQTHRHNARGIRAKPLTNTTAGEKQTKNLRTTKVLVYNFK